MRDKLCISNKYSFISEKRLTTLHSFIIIQYVKRISKTEIHNGRAKRN